MKNTLFLRKPLYLIILTAAISTLLVALFFGTSKLEKEFGEKMVDISTSDIISISNNSARSIQNLLDKHNDYISDILMDEALQKNIEKNLEVLLTENIKYAYVLYKDEKNLFRFLVDASKEDKAFVNQKFDVANPQWLELYKKKKPILIKQFFLKELSITYLIPIIQNNEVKLVMAIDFAVKKVKEISSMIDLVKKAILFIIMIIAIFLLILIIQTIKYYLVKKSSFIDKLTNLYNRNFLQESQSFINLNEYIIAAVDIDYFKKINDTYGHDAGDKVLKQVAQTILNCTRKKEDIVVRYGGEEFLVLVRTKRDDQVKSLNVLERIIETMRVEKFSISDKDQIDVTVSIGVNLSPDKSRKFSEAFKLADIALYNAKNKGRDRIEIYSDDKSTNETYMTINDIREAIDENRVTCYYQKIVDTKTQEVTHYEALLRIISKDGAVMLPHMILPVVKGTFISRNITKEVMRICYEKLVENPNIKINMNLNPQDIMNESILNILKEYGKDTTISNRLGLEVIESEEIVNYEQSKKNLLELKELGYKIFIDDFGSGYSNFIYLTEIQSDYIKIDGNIIKKIMYDEISYLVVKNIVNFAKEANIKIVAEYVSNEDIYYRIKVLGIDYSQGYLFSVPSKDL